MSRMVSSSSAVAHGILDDIELSKIKQTSFIQRSEVTQGIDELARSIRHQGLLQPIVVRPTPPDNRDHYFEIVAGNRRYKACKYLGWRKAVCHIVNLTDKEAFEVSLIENIQRKTFHPLEEAKAFEKYVFTHGWGSISELAGRIGKSTSYVDKRMRLLTLPSDIVLSISNLTISPSTAEELLPINDANEQSQLAKTIQNKRLSSRAVRALARNKNRSNILNFNKGNSVNISDDDISFDNVSAYDINIETQKAFDKAILIINYTSRKLAAVIDNVEENWILYEILMQHKRALHDQIDLLIKQKRKI